MEYITLKNSDLKVSRICMGGCPMGGYGWGAVQENELIDAVRAAVDNGVTFFDTADTYGLGQSEITLGKALGADRTRVVISDKFGVRAEKGKPTVYDNSREYIISACEASLKRLNTDYIDLYTVHYRDYSVPLTDVTETLELLKKQGKIRHFALSNISEKDMDELEAVKDKYSAFQDEYSLACRKNEKAILEFRQLPLTPMTWGSLGQGILTGKYNKDNVNFGADDRRSRDIYVNFHGEKLLQNLRIVETLKEIAKNHGKSTAAAAVRFILDYINDSVVLVGIKRPSQLIGNLEAIGWNLSENEINELLKISD